MCIFVCKLRFFIIAVMLSIRLRRQVALIRSRPFRAPPLSLRGSLQAVLPYILQAVLSLRLLGADSPSKVEGVAAEFATQTGAYESNFYRIAIVFYEDARIMSALILGSGM